MFKEVLHIIPKLSTGELAAMENTLSRRFGNVAKRFGKGLLGTLAGGGIAGIALGLIDKLLNPLKETQDAIDRTLKNADDVVTNAQQFGTTAGRLFRLHALGKSTGLDPSSLDVLLEKFQGAVAAAAKAPNEPSAVKNYVGQKDTAEAFFQFIQELQKLNKTQQVIVQQEVFGEKQILKMADFLQTDFPKQAGLVGGPTADQLDRPLQKLAGLNDLKDINAAHLELVDTLQKGKEINARMVNAQAIQEEQAARRENKNIANYNNLAAISIATNRISDLITDCVTGITTLVLRVTDLNRNVSKLTESRFAKGLMKMVGKE